MSTITHEYPPTLSYDEQRAKNRGSYRGFIEKALAKKSAQEGHDVDAVQSNIRVPLEGNRPALGKKSWPGVSDEDAILTVGRSEGTYALRLELKPEKMPNGMLKDRTIGRPVGTSREFGHMPGIRGNYKALKVEIPPEGEGDMRFTALFPSSGKHEAEQWIDLDDLGDVPRGSLATDTEFFMDVCMVVLTGMEKENRLHALGQETGSRALALAAVPASV
jgi:hypothetical protein